MASTTASVNRPFISTKRNPRRGKTWHRTFGTLLSSRGTDAHPADHHTPRRPTRGQLFSLCCRLRCRQARRAFGTVVPATSHGRLSPVSQLAQGRRTRICSIRFQGHLSNNSLYGGPLTRAIQRVDLKPAEVLHVGASRGARGRLWSHDAVTLNRCSRGTGHLSVSRPLPAEQPRRLSGSCSPSQVVLNLYVPSKHGGVKAARPRAGHEASRPGCDEELGRATSPSPRASPEGRRRSPRPTHLDNGLRRRRRGTRGGETRRSSHGCPGPPTGWTRSRASPRSAGPPRAVVGPPGSEPGAGRHVQAHLLRSRRGR